MTRAWVPFALFSAAAFAQVPFNGVSATGSLRTKDGHVCQPLATYREGGTELQTPDCTQALSEVPALRFSSPPRATKKVGAWALSARIERTKATDGARMGMAGDPIGPLEPEVSTTLVIEATAQKKTVRVVEWQPVDGIESIEKVFMASPRVLVVIFEPVMAMRDRPGQKLQYAVAFDVSASLPH